MPDVVPGTPGVIGALGRREGGNISRLACVLYVSSYAAEYIKRYRLS
jgi:hypothetical protein